ncbi:MAG: BMP family ABC transporter substrate-binding protein [Candidatus Riflebacteria bacterium HGW-Riflebacteria-2]|jgi:basic membrane protein A|nr:MAG: BMP family ABC transporter substrate-binding protein [Candidatus Riflebacteria bacterium HGW-Riflebacteria-2]
MPRKPTFLKKSVYCTGILILVLLLFTTGCCKNELKDASGSTRRIGLMITPRGLNDKGFNDYAYDGLKQAEKKFNIEGVVIEPSTMQDHEASLRFFAGQKFDAIIVVGVGFNEAIRKVAAEHPGLQFFVIDSEIDEGNIRGIYFREDEGAYLCGYLAARMSKTGKIGFIGGVKIPVIERFATGYRNGALAAVNSTEVVEQFVAEDYTGFNSPEKASEMALDMYRTGCDIVFPAAGASGLGVISAAVKSRGQVIGVDMNQDSLAPGLVLTSMLKRVDLVVESIISNICEGKNPATIKRSYGIADGVIGLTDFQLSSKVVGDALISELASVRKAIIDGTIKTGVTGR